MSDCEMFEKFFIGEKVVEWLVANKPGFENLVAEYEKYSTGPYLGKYLTINKKTYEGLCQWNTDFENIKEYKKEYTDLRKEETRNNKRDYNKDYNRQHREVINGKMRERYEEKKSKSREQKSADFDLDRLVKTLYRKYKDGQLQALTENRDLYNALNSVIIGA